MGIHELRVNDVRDEMMDDDSSFLAADFGWWWLRLWVGLILDQEAGSRVGWVAQAGRPHEETPLDVRTRVNFPQCTQRAERFLQEGILMETNDLGAHAFSF